MAAPRKLVALASFEAEVGGEAVLVRAGDVVPASSPLVKGREALFAAEADYVQTDGSHPAPAEGKPSARGRRR